MLFVQVLPQSCQCTHQYLPGHPSSSSEAATWIRSLDCKWQKSGWMYWNQTEWKRIECACVHKTPTKDKCYPISNTQMTFASFCILSKWNIQNVLLNVWFLLLRITLIRLIHIVCYGCSFFILIQCITTCVNILQLVIQFTVNGHLGSFPFGAIINRVHSPCYI